MPTRVLFTVDTELTWRHYRPGGDWREHLALSYDPAGVGISYQLEQFAQHGLKACFFVDPMPALVYGIEPIKRMVGPILAAGQEVQLHLHSFWPSVADGSAAPSGFELTDFDVARQREMIALARELLVEAGAPAPIAFRAGSYAANAATLDALSALGIAYDSSHNGSVHPEWSALPLDAALIEPVFCRGVIEVPVTQIEQRGGRLRHLQLCAVSAAEIEAACLHADRHHHPVVTIVSHSFELATRNGRRANAILRRRFERVCRFLAANEAGLPTVRFADLGGPAPCGAAPLPSRPMRTVRRMAEQLYSDARYERPGFARSA